MNMPGYTAEASLTPASTSYRTIATGTCYAAGVVVPQGPVKCLAACLCCWKYHNGFCCDYCEICAGIGGPLVATGGFLD